MHEGKSPLGQPRAYPVSLASGKPHLVRLSLFGSGLSGLGVNNMLKVIVAHPDKQHSMKLAYALQKCGKLSTYVTRIYTTWEHYPFSLLKAAPNALKQRIENQIFSKVKHSNHDLENEKVIVIANEEAILSSILARLGIIKTVLLLELLYKSSVRFQKALVRYVEKVKPDAVVCYDRHAYYVFSALKKSGIKLILDMSSAHPATIKQILENEFYLYPELKSSISFPGITDRYYGNVVTEALMADYVLVASNLVKNSCIQNGVDESKLILLPYGTDINRNFQNSKRRI